MSFVFNPNRDKCLFSYSQHIENWFCFRRVIWSFHEHTCFSRLKRLRDFVYRRFNFSPTFREEREKIRHFGFYSKEIYYWLSINTSSSTFMRGAGGASYGLGSLSLKLLPYSTSSGQSNLPVSGSHAQVFCMAQQNMNQTLTYIAYPSPVCKCIWHG